MKIICKRCIILRHERTIENELGIIQDQIDGGDLVNKVSYERIDFIRASIVGSSALIVSSDSKRAISTTQQIYQALSLDYVATPLLRQRYWGNVAGKSVKNLTKYCNRPFEAEASELAEGAEGLQETLNRAQKAVEYIAELQAETIIVITHDEFSNYLINVFLQEGVFKRPLLNEEIHILDFLDGSIKETQLHIHSFVKNVVLNKNKVLQRNDAPSFSRFSIGKRILNNRGFELYTENDQLPNDRVNALIVGDQLVTQEIVDKYSNLKIIARLGKGIDNIKISSNSNIIVTNTPGCNEGAVAEFTINSILNAVQLIRKKEAYQTLLTSTHQVREWSCYNIGLIGFGTIAQIVAKNLQKLNFNVFCWTKNFEKHRNEIEKNNVTYERTIDNVCKKCDIVSLHVPLNDKTANMIGEKQFALIGNRGYLINTSRAKIVNRKDLIEALDKEIILGATIDVWAGSNNRIDTVLDDILKFHPRVVATSHIAGYTTNAIQRSIALCAYNINWVLKNQSEKAHIVSI